MFVTVFVTVFDRYERWTNRSLTLSIGVVSFHFCLCHIQTRTHSHSIYIGTVLGVLFNCAEPEAISLAFAKLRDVPGLSDGTGKTKLGAYANRLTPVPEGWTMEDSDGAQPFREDVDPEEYYESFVRLWVKEFGVRMIGGCCGITPEHIHRIHRGLVQEGLYLS